MGPRDLQVVFTGDLSDKKEDAEGLPPPPPIEGPPLMSIPKSKSMPEVGAADNKALEELCQSVTAKLDALANKPLPGRSPKALAQMADRPDPWRRGSAGLVTLDGEGDSADIKRPDKSRTMPPTSLTTSLPQSTPR